MTLTTAAMGTLVTITAHHPASGTAIERALAWFEAVEACCSRFDPESELRYLCRSVKEDVAISPMLFEALGAALAVAQASGGAFDPTVGARMEAAGFDRHHRGGERNGSGVRPESGVSFRDVKLDPRRRTARLARPLVLDLGGVAKGMAIDLAARELAHFGDFAIDAGGDLYLAGRNAAGQPWQAGVRHPRHPDAIFETVAVSGAALCTSGDYERGEHVLDPRSAGGRAPVCSVSVIASSAMAADALATAAMVLAPAAGLRLLERERVAGLIVTADLQRFATAHWPGAA